jgi:hypothetical protein
LITTSYLTLVCMGLRAYPPKTTYTYYLVVILLRILFSDNY